MQKSSTFSLQAYCCEKVLIAPDGRRLRHVHVICVIVIAFVGGKEGKKRVKVNGDWVRGPKLWAVDSEHEASKGKGLQLHTKSHHSK